jgi:drug/metabolite transporter (DMT)-like permease
MSMAISMMAMIWHNNESITALKIIGIITAFIGVILISLPNTKVKNGQSAIWMLLILFIGSGLLDFLLNLIQKSELNGLHPGLFSAMGFLFAGIIGVSLIGIQIIRKKTKIKLRSILAGIILGIPNYFSIYLLLAAYKSTGWSDSTVLAVMNVAVVILSTFIGLLIFSERLNLKKSIGLCFSILAIIILYISNAS